MSKISARGFARILLATDGSPSSLEACEAAVSIAKSYESSVTVLSAIPSASAFATPLGGKYHSLQVEKARQVVETAASTLKGGGVDVVKTETPQSKASPVETIVEYASGAAIDLIVMGTRGLGGLKRALLGSVSSGVASAAPCATLVVRAKGKEGGAKAHQRAVGSVGSILVATDGSENAQEALVAAVDLAKHLNAKLEIVHAAHVSGVLWAVGIPGSTVPSQEIEEDIVRRGEEIVSRAAKFVEEGGLPKPKTYVLTRMESPAQGITDLAETEGSDLIVTGTRGNGGFKKMLLGSVASGVLQYAPCSVLVVK
ncbi:MAG: universal stress protein [Thaumarchaeota archaeon]|nr:universal stress protein [Nitrososphaerota archaeon]